MSEVKLLDVDALANEIRRVDGNHTLGAGALAEALMAFLQENGTWIAELEQQRGGVVDERAAFEAAFENTFFSSCFERDEVGSYAGRGLNGAWMGWQARARLNPPRKFRLGDPVRKTKGSQWSGRVVGFYSTEQTPDGYAVESFTEKGSVQIYPGSALEACDGVEPRSALDLVGATVAPFEFRVIWDGVNEPIMHILNGRFSGNGKGRFDRGDMAVAVAEKIKEWAAYEHGDIGVEDTPKTAPGECVAVPEDLRVEAEGCAFVLENIGGMDAEDVNGDDVDLRFEDAEGRDTGCDVSIVEYAERGAKVIRALLAQQGKTVPASCRQRLAAEGKPYPRSSCSVCGKFSPKWKECDAILAQQGKEVGDE